MSSDHNIGDAQIWPDDDPHYELTRDEVAREVLDADELAEYLREKRR